MSEIREGLFITVVGIGAVFLVLVLIMFLMMAIERLFRGEGAVAEGEPASDVIAARDEPLPVRPEPEDLAEVAAVTLALAHYLRRRGRQIGTSIVINDVHHQLQIGDISHSPVAVVVDGEGYQGYAGQGGLAHPAHSSLSIETHDRSRQRERNWRLAYPLPQGGHWWRSGWSGRGRIGGQGSQGIRD